MLQDIAVLTKGIVISEEQGYKLENADLTYFQEAPQMPKLQLPSLLQFVVVTGSTQ